MQTSFNFPAPKLLRYAFLALMIGGGLLLILNFASNLGLAGSGPFLRGYVTTYHMKDLVDSALPEGQGTLRVMKHSENSFVLLDFASRWSLFKIRHLLFLLSDNMRWVLAIMTMYQMFRIFHNIDRKEVFSQENVRRIRIIAFCVLIYPFLTIEATLQFKAIVTRIPGHGLSIAPITILYESLAVGVLLSLIIFALAEVFRTGAHLQQEQDLTI